MAEIKKFTKLAANPDDTKRVTPIEEHEFRDKFQRDRDRILYSKEFRRLSGKTQIFVTGSDDNIRTRLTHTLEVAQIAETISRVLGLNVLLTNAIALGHDIGHTPFGHVGERTLNHIMNGCFDYYGYNNELIDEEKGFKHNLQGVRVASFLEENSDKNDGGLNLTKYCLWGIQNHTSRTYKDCEFCKNKKECRYKNNGKECSGKLSVGFYNESLKLKNQEILKDERDWTLEAIVVAYADEIAQRHHDIEDGIYAGIIDLDHLCDYIFADERFDEKIRKDLKSIKNSGADKSQKIRELSRAIVDFYVKSYIDSIESRICDIFKDLHLDIKEPATRWKKEVFDYVSSRGIFRNYFGFDSPLREADKEFSEYLKNHILYSELAQSMDGKASYIIKQLFKAYLTNPQQLPDRTIMSITDDWLRINDAKANNTQNYMTKESAAREKLKDLLKKDDPQIRSILLRRICDFVAGMTDNYALQCYDRLYGVKRFDL